MSKKPTVHIIGAGISGLIAAHVLEEHGFAPVVLEATDRPGGRVKTDVVQGFQLDHGFQVLLSEYPAARKYLDYAKLEVQEFKAGACIFVGGRQQFFGDPLRDPSVLFSTLFSGVGSLLDKIKIFQLNWNLKKKSLADIFASPETTTHTYLKQFGFSDQVIGAFFRPFFTGIFLETELQTSSRMFEFVFKLFGEGMALLPKAGIEAIPQQLTAHLKQTTFRFNTKVTAIQDNVLTLENGDTITSDYTIVATAAHQLLPELLPQPTVWKSCQTLYFTAPQRIYNKPFIGLSTNKDSLINNIFYHTSLPMAHRGKGELLSVTVVNDHTLSDKELIAQVTQELQQECGISDLTFLKIYHIPKALPSLSNLKYDHHPVDARLTDHLFLAGDVRLNGSLNAAMLAGEKAALGVVEALAIKKELPHSSQ